MTSERTRNRLARLEAALGRANEPPVPTLTEVYQHFGVMDRHRRAVEAGECAYGDGLEPVILQSMRELDRFYGHPWPNDLPPAAMPRRCTA